MNRYGRKSRSTVRAGANRKVQLCIKGGALWVRTPTYSPSFTEDLLTLGAGFSDVSMTYRLAPFHMEAVKSAIDTHFPGRGFKIVKD